MRSNKARKNGCGAAVRKYGLGVAGGLFAFGLLAAPAAAQDADDEAPPADPDLITATLELYMNAQVSDRRSKLRQRVGILTDREAYESVAAMEERLERLWERQSGPDVMP